ncbi:DUF1906 domain-containing protein [uncultured Corynebacterium sp.]|uniref:DUF1906 domain-containing protein n=1 Tax=uncultured Corynebacterium sp. TaxID=159447 RepID=UPI0025F32CD3|nr:DUF1906 domain-containing protein [uncultured Corynebacterium sp.]
MPTPSIGNRSLSRRGLFKAGALTAAFGAFGAYNLQAAPQAQALGPILGTVLDYSAGVPSGAAVKAAGHLGAVRYVSQRRPGANWMLGKPVSLKETKDFAAHGLATASVYQFGRAGNADWLAGAAGAATHAPQAIALHKAAGGPTGRPIYIAIDDNPTRAQYTNQIKPYLQAFSAALKAAGYQTGVYGNYNVIDWASKDGIGSFFWMHDWGSGGKIHPRTTIHQLPKAQQRTVGGVLVDINHVYAKDWGQWTPGQAAGKRPSQNRPAAPAPQAPAGNSTTDAINHLSSRLNETVPNMPNLPRVDGNSISYNGSSVSMDQVQQAADLAKRFSGR